MILQVVLDTLNELIEDARNCGDERGAEALDFARQEIVRVVEQENRKRGA